MIQETNRFGLANIFNLLVNGDFTDHFHSSLVDTVCLFKHGTIIRTGITCKKIPCFMCDLACRWLIVENTKIF